MFVLLYRYIIQIKFSLHNSSFSGPDPLSKFFQVVQGEVKYFFLSLLGLYYLQLKTVCMSKLHTLGRLVLSPFTLLHYCGLGTGIFQLMCFFCLPQQNVKAVLRDNRERNMSHSLDVAPSPRMAVGTYQILSNFSFKLRNN